MKLWQALPDLELLNSAGKNTIHESLGIRITAVGDDFIEGTMPVDARTHQPMGFLHGGASVVLAESLGSLGSTFILGPENGQCFGIEVNASHIKSMRSGTVTGRARALHLGAKLHNWEIRLTDEKGDLVCICRLNVFVRRDRS